MGIAEVTTTRLKEYYVYTLVHREQQKVFYVGKGQGERGHQHEKDAENLASDSSKISTINSIKVKGENVDVRVIGRFDNEDAAFAVESTLISWVYGFNNLTNSVHGHGADTVREIGDFCEVEGLDIPLRTRRSNGEYSDEMEREKLKNESVKRLKELRKYIESKINISFDEPMPKPKESPRWVRYTHTLNGVEVHIQCNSQLARFNVGINALSSQKQDLQRVTDICNYSDLDVKANGKYAILTSSARTREKETCLYYLKKILCEVNRATYLIDNKLN
ncbi:MAG: GIY-YIG nuclease family protein [Thalassotalea sp.]|nr:GIY-YIG nuclease family protein [Thalassotalea sp.]